MQEKITRSLFVVALFMLFCHVTVKQATAQQRGITLKIGYPLTVGDTFLSSYDGILGFGFTYDQPILSSLLLRPAVEYERLNLEHAEIYADVDDVPANVYTARLGLGYPVALTRSLSVMPEVGAGYTRIGFQEERGSSQSGFSTWVALNPTYDVGGAVDVGVSLGYKAAFLEAPEMAFDQPYNRQLHALTFGATLTYDLTF